MTIQEIGSLGEVLGALATLGTLIYVARQIRANTRAMQAEARRSHYAINRENNGLVSGNADLADLMLRGLMDAASLSPAEELRFTFLMASFVNNAELGFHEHSLGVIDEWEMRRAMLATVRLLRSPGGARFWKRHGRNYDGPFVTYVENLDLQSR